MDVPFQLCAFLAGIVSIALHRAKRIDLTGALIWPTVLSCAAAVLLARDPFHAIRHLAWLVFAHAPFWSLLVLIVFWRRHRWLAIAGATLAALLLLIAFDAFLIEPHDLELTRYTLTTPKLRSPLRIVVLSDIQTDFIGDYERDVFKRAAAEKADLVLLPGDFLQLAEPAFDREQRKLANLLSGLSPRLGIWAVEGNVEPQDWRRLFEGTKVNTFDGKQTEQITDDLALTGMTLHDSFDTNLKVDPQEHAFHIAFGHAPDFALGTIHADLLIAGHTHGGQVRLPFIGPLLTLSRVPRKWAAGLTSLPGNRTLIVSRGIGLERGYAPRLRFLCRPELVVIDVKPGQ